MHPQAHLSLPVVVAFLVAFVAQASRLLAFTKPLWNRLPIWLQGWLPPLAVVLTSLGASIVGVQSWGDLAYAVLGAFMLALPGAPSNRTAPDPEPPAKKGPPPMATLMLCFMLGVPVVLFCSACGWLKGSAVPVLEECAPTAEGLLADVAKVLTSGDYEKELAREALMEGQTTVDCAVQEYLRQLKSGKVAASPERTTAREHAEAYLAKRHAK